MAAGGLAGPDRIAAYRHNDRDRVSLAFDRRNRHICGRDDHVHVEAHQLPRELWKSFGSGLAGLGGALGAEILGLDPIFPLKYMIYFLIVVTVGGTSSLTGPFLASLLLGIGDVAGKYYVPTLGSFVIYSIMIVALIWRPQGLFTRGSAR